MYLCSSLGSFHRPKVLHCPTARNRDLYKSDLQSILIEKLYRKQTFSRQGIRPRWLLLLGIHSMKDNRNDNLPMPFYNLTKSNTFLVNEATLNYLSERKYKDKTSILERFTVYKIATRTSSDITENKHTCKHAH